MDYTENYHRYLITIGYNSKTIDQKTNQLSTYITYVQKEKVLTATHQSILDYYEYLTIQKANCKRVSINYYMITLHQFYDWLLELGYLDCHPFGNLKLLKDTSQYQRIPITEAKIKRLYKSTESHEEKLLLIFGYGCGMRCKEILQLQVQDIKYDKALLVVRNGKYNKRRVIPLQPLHLQYLRQYTLEKGLSKKSRFITVSHPTLLIYFKNLQKRLGWLPPYYSLHHLRHSIASHLVDRGLNLQLVQHFLGHSSLQTTQIYVTPIKDIQLWKTT